MNKLGYIGLAGILAVFIFMATDARADEKYPMCKQYTTWYEKNWCETKEFQKQGWEDGKKDLAKTKEDIKNLPTTVSTGVTNLVNWVSDGTRNILSYVSTGGKQ